MSNRQRRAGLAPALAALALCLVPPAAARAQDEGAQPRRQAEARRDEVNHEVQLHVLATADAPGVGAKVPQALEGVIRQLKNSLPPSDYVLVSTYVQRVRDGGTLEVKSAGGPPLAASTPPNSLTPSFFQLSLGRVKQAEDSAGQKFVNVESFRLGLKVPIQTATVSADKGGQGYPVIQYEDTGIVTQLSVREGDPTLVGTLNTTRPGQYFALVLTIRRAGR